MSKLFKSSVATHQLSRRRMIGSAAAVAAGITLGAPSSRYSAFAQNGGGEITVLYKANDQEVFDALAAGFAEQTGITLKLEEYPDDYLAGQELVTTRLASGDTSLDVFFCDDIQASMYGAAGWLEPLDESLAANDVDLSDWPTTLLTDVSSWDGALYRVPWQTDIEIFLYRTDFFEEAGLENPADWAALVEAGTALTQGEDRYGIAVSAANGGALTNEIQHWTNQAGGSIIDLASDGSKEALQFYKDLWAVHKIAPSSSPQEDGSTLYQGFVDGRFATWWTWDATLGRLRNDAEFWNDQVDAFVPLPSGPVNSQTTIGCWGWAVPSGGTKKDLATQFVSYASSIEGMRSLMIAGRSPARQSLWTDEEYVAVAPQLLIYGALGEQDEPFKARPITPNFQQIDDAARTSVHSFLTDQIDLDTAVNDAMKKITPLLED